MDVGGNASLNTRETTRSGQTPLFHSLPTLVVAFLLLLRAAKKERSEKKKEGRRKCDVMKCRSKRLIGILFSFILLGGRVASGLIRTDCKKRNKGTREEGGEGRYNVKRKTKNYLSNAYKI